MQINWPRNKGTIAVVGVVLLLLVATAFFVKDSLGVLLPLLTAVVSGSFAYYFSKKKEDVNIWKYERWQSRCGWD